MRQDEEQLPAKPKRHERPKIFRQIMHMLRKGTYRKSHIKDWLRRKHGITHRHTVTVYISEAKKLLAAEYGKTTDEHRQESYHFYRSKRDNPSVKDGQQIQAQSKIDDLLGLKIRSEGDEAGSELNVNVSFQGVVDAVKGRLGDEQVIDVGAERVAAEKQIVESTVEPTLKSADEIDLSGF